MVLQHQYILVIVLEMKKEEEEIHLIGKLIFDVIFHPSIIRHFEILLQMHLSA